MKIRLMVLVACAGLASCALGQGEAQWVLLPGSGTADGDFDIEEWSFETNCVYKLGIDLKPSPGETLADGSTVVGFGSLVADVIRKTSWGLHSSVTWTVNPELTFLTGDLTRKDETTQELSDINAGQIPDFGPFSTEDPLWAITIDWSLADLGGGRFDHRDRRVGATVATQGEDAIQAYVLQPGAAFAAPQAWPLPDFALEHFVRPIPSPGLGYVTAAGVMTALSRRRR